MQITQAHTDAARAIVDLVADIIGGKTRQVHSATAIASSARLAGSFMFRSFNVVLKDVKPGSAVLSEQANVKGPVLINVVSAMLRNFEVPLDQKKMESVSRVDANLSLLETLDATQEGAYKIMKQQNLDFEQMAYACAMATAFIIKECSNDLAPESGFHTAVYSFIEGAKTYPPEFGKPAPAKKGFFGFWK